MRAGTIAWLRVEGAAVFAAATIVYFQQDFDLLWYLLLILFPDVMMVGYAVDEPAGRLSYNLGHSYLLPLITGVLGLATDAATLIGISLIWLAHIGLDRGLGFGLKTGPTFKDTHLGTIGRKK